MYTAVGTQVRARACCRGCQVVLWLPGGAAWLPTGEMSGFRRRFSFTLPPFYYRCTQPHHCVTLSHMRGLRHRVAASCNCELRVHFERSYCSFAPDKRAFVPGVVRARRYFYTSSRILSSQTNSSYARRVCRIYRKLAEPN